MVHPLNRLTRLPTHPSIHTPNPPIPSTDPPNQKNSYPYGYCGMGGEVLSKGKAYETVSSSSGDDGGGDKEQAGGAGGSGSGGPDLKVGRMDACLTNMYRPHQSDASETPTRANHTNTKHNIATLKYVYL